MHTHGAFAPACPHPDSVAGVDKPLIVSGSRDHLLKVWTLPSRGEESYQYAADEDNQRPNPYYKLDLRGHEDEVRDISVGGRQVASQVPAIHRITVRSRFVHVWLLLAVSVIERRVLALRVRGQVSGHSPPLKARCTVLPVYVPLGLGILILFSGWSVSPTLTTIERGR